jgi:L-arabinokinase
MNILKSCFGNLILQNFRIVSKRINMSAKLKNRRLAYYITPHGFGHAVRSIEVIRHLLFRDPQIKIHVVSTIPEFLIYQNLTQPVSLKTKQLDIGLVQQDSIRFDLNATLEALESLNRNEDALVSEETAFLKNKGIQAVVCDIPFLPFVAAAHANIPAVGISNFTWDWIYDSYISSDSRWAVLVDWIRKCYQNCDLFLQLPMHGDCSVFSKIQDVPLVTRKAQRGRQETRKILNLDLDQKVYLVSFGFLDLEETAQNRIEDISHAVFLFKHPLSFRFSNGICLDDLPLSYADVVGAVDGVITKPGYGIVADCLAHSTPMIYTDRGSFPEYDILVQAMGKHLAIVHLSSADLYGGRWKAAIEELERQPRAVASLPGNGAEVCAEIILRYLNWP